MLLEHVMAIGQTLAPHVYAEPLGYDAALGRVVDWMHAERARKPAFTSWLERTLLAPCGPAHVLWTARWASCGFPQIVLGHRLGASLAATRIAPEVAVDVKAPWPAYLVVLPEPLFEVSDKLAGGRMSISYLTCFQAGRFTHMTARGRSSEYTLSVGHKNHASGLAERGDDDSIALHGCDDEHARALVILWRLMANIELEMSSRFVEQPVARPVPTSRVEPPKPATWRLVRDVVIDCRAAVGRYVTEGVSTPHVRTLVRGHWKRQFFGEARVNRRWIHVEPYWRGPEEASVPTRSHRLG